MMARERCTLTSGNDTLFQLHDGPPELRSGAAAPARRLGGGRAGDHAQHHREAGRARRSASPTACRKPRPTSCSTTGAIRVELRIAGLAKPHDGIEVRITQRDTGAALPPGETGEIEVRGWNVMRGYYKNPEETAKAFTPDGWLRTGDLGVLTADGRLRMVGRAQGRVPRRRRERRAGRGRGGAARASRRRDRAGGRRARRAARRGAARLRHAQGRRAATEAELDRVRARQRCANFRVPRYLAIVDELRRHRHDGERQGAEEPAARARDRAIRARRASAGAEPSAERRDERRRPVRMLRARRAAARDRVRADRDQARADRALRRARLPARIEATSYSNPKVVPQFADASELLAVARARREGVHYKATCANVRAVERALADLDAGFGVTEISLLVSASEAHSMKNLQASRAPTQWEQRAQDGGGGAGPLPPDRHDLGRVRLPVRRRGRSRRRGRRRASASPRLGVDHVALGDTTGMATPAAHEGAGRPPAARGAGAHA